MRKLPKASTRNLKSFIFYFVNIGCSFKFLLKVGIEESIVNAAFISLQNKSTKSEVRFKQLIRDP
jgi:hypothetical protein